ncbi:MAG TPA: hypothetical protein VIN58_05785 [Roseateles sp.]
MNRLQSELQRLYASDGCDVRALVLELARPADWDALGQVWRGVQADLQLPAPGIAVSGTDGLQLWFSLQQPVSAARAGDFLARLRARYLPGIAPTRVRAATQPPTVPAQDAATGNWSAFVAPDLAPVFADTPWLDIQPGAEGQADLLARLESVKPAAFDAAMQTLKPAAPAMAASSTASRDLDPRRFLQQVLNDESAPLALRVEAAKVLLQHR